MPYALFDFDRSGVEIDVLPFKTEYFRDPGAGCDAGFDNKLIGFVQSAENPGGLLERKDSPFPLVPFLSELRPA